MAAAAIRAAAEVRCGTDWGPVTPALVGGMNVGAFDAAGNYFVMNSASNTLYRIDVNTVTATAITLSAVPNGADLTLGPSGFLWGATGSAAPTDRIVRINPKTGPVTFFPVPAGALTTGAGESGFGGVLSGTRRAELVALHLEDVDTDPAAIRVVGKGGKQRLVRLPPPSGRSSRSGWSSGATPPDRSSAPSTAGAISVAATPSAARPSAKSFPAAPGDGPGRHLPARLALTPGSSGHVPR